MSDRNLQGAIPPIGEALDDRSASGRRRPWREYKMSNELLSAAYEDVDARKAERLRDCASWLVYTTEPGSNRKVLETANFCRVRLCPICSWRRSLKAQAQMMQVADYLAKGEERYSYILLTLTVRNVTADSLAGELDHLMGAWNKMSQRRQVRDAVCGYYRALEITHNLRDDTYHPHYHVLFAVRPSYYHKGYISQARWTELWQEALRCDYTPVVDVRRVKGADAAAIAEVAKYAVKTADYIVPDDWNLTVDTVRLLDKVLNHRRLLSFGGCIAEARRRLQLDDIEDGDLLHLDNEVEDAGEGGKIMYVWYSGYRQYYGV